MSTPTQDAGRAEGERRKQAKTEAVERRHAVLVRRVQRAFVEHLMANPSGTTDDIRDGVTIPEDSGSAFWGASVVNLARSRIIRPVAYVVSTRPERHACPIRAWSLAVDHDRARQWLDTHPDLADPEPSDDAEAATPTPFVERPASATPISGSAQQTFTFG